MTILGKAVSQNGVPIRLTTERWSHIVEAHDYMAGLHEWVLTAIAEPDIIAWGWERSLMAIQHLLETPLGERHMIVVYREVTEGDGFVVTAFMTSNVRKVLKRGVLWQRSS